MKNKLREEGLTQADVVFIMRKPSRVERETRGVWPYVGQVEGKWFRVVIAGDDPNVVISVHERRRP